MNDPERNAPMDPEPIPVEEKRNAVLFAAKRGLHDFPARASSSSSSPYTPCFSDTGACQAPSYAYDILLLALFFTILGYDQIQPLATFKAFRKMFFPVLPDTD